MKMYLNNKVVSESVHMANTISTRMIGLLNRKSLEEGESLLIEPCNSIHTFFMRFNIDVVFLDKNFKVVKIIRNMPPWRITLPYFKVRSVLEASGNSLAMINEGDQLELRDV